MQLPAVVEVLLFTTEYKLQSTKNLDLTRYRRRRYFRTHLYAILGRFGNYYYIFRLLLLKTLQNPSEYKRITLFIKEEYIRCNLYSVVKSS